MSDKMKAQQKQQQEAAKKAAAKKQAAVTKEVASTTGRRSSRLKNGEGAEESPDAKQTKKATTKKATKKNTASDKSISSYFKKADVDVNGEKPSVQEALADPRQRAAMNEEMKSLQKNETWELIDYPPEKKLVGCQRIYTMKNKSDEIGRAHV